MPFDAPPPLLDPLAALDAATCHLSADALVSDLACRFAGRIALVSSFGADSAVLLAMVAQADPAMPVLFLDTGRHFPETLAHRDALVARLGLTDVRSIPPDPAVAAADPVGLLHHLDPDRCCFLRKVAPLEPALASFAMTLNGRRRHQSATRAALPRLEHDGARLKASPIADWTVPQVAARLRDLGLPPHPLVGRGYPSVGCAPCTARVREGEDPRAGRWAGSAKTECGIHRPVPAAA